MNEFNRRTFLKASGRAGLLLGAGSLTPAALSIAKGAAPGEKVVLAAIGIRGRGMGHIAGFASRPDCVLAYLCDVDSQYFPAAIEKAEAAGGRRPKTVTDMREVLDDKSVDAVVIATPDHWHAPATILACQAGKDVYVEKPVSNNVWEGRKMVEAARKYGRIVQSGMQNRSAPYNIKAKEFIDSGRLGTIDLVRVYNQKPQTNFSDLGNAPAPPTLNWDLWNGPARQDYNATMHRNWHAFWRYGGGEVTNDGVHQLDLARWVVGLDLPSTVYSLGRGYREPGASETPDTVITTFDFGKITLVYEQTLYAPYMIKSDAAVRDGDIFPYWPQNGERIEIFGSKGLMILGRHGCGWQVFDRPKQREPVVIAQMHGRFPDRWHHDNFLECVRSRSTPTADIEEGHRSAMICHCANISYRVGNRLLKLDSQAERFVDDEAANGFLRYEYRAPYEVPSVV